MTNISMTKWLLNALHVSTIVQPVTIKVLVVAALLPKIELSVYFNAPVIQDTTMMEPINLVFCAIILVLLV